MIIEAIMVKKFFNTWSVIQALTNNLIDNYWSEIGRNDELETIINFDISDIREEDFIELIAGMNYQYN